MKINEKLYKKYGANTVILPPPSEEELDVEIPAHKELPHVADPDLEEMAKHQFIYDRDQDLLNKIMKIRDEKRMEKEINEQIHKSDKAKLEREQSNAPTVVMKAPDTVVEKRPKKEALSVDHIVKLCSKYNDLCNKF